MHTDTTQEITQWLVRPQQILLQTIIEERDLIMDLHCSIIYCHRLKTFSKRILQVMIKINRNLCSIIHQGLRLPKTIVTQWITEKLKRMNEVF